MEDKNVSDIEKRDTMIDTYIRRQGVIKSKFPDISNAPQSIQNEYFSLTTLIDSLQTSRRNIWGPTLSSDGLPIDSFVSQKYENALVNFSELNEKNAEYITPEDEANFKFPEIDFEGLRNKVQLMQTTVDYRTLYGEIAKIGQDPLPEATRAKLYEIRKEMATKQLRDETTPQKDNVPAPVNESNFAQIYGKAKGKIQEVFGKIKSFFKEQSHEKSNDSQDIDER